MNRRILSILLVLSLLLAGLGCPAALAAEVVSAQTKLAGSTEGKLNNIELAAAAVNGTRLAYGERFSFNDTVGPRTYAMGYVSAPNGRGVRVTGGGVAQVATTLYLALQKLSDRIHYNGLATYGGRFKDNYVADGRNAVITDYSAGTDFSFTNYADDMLISMWTNDNYLCCELTVGDDGAFTGGADDEGWFVDWENAFQPAAPVAQTVTARVFCGSDEDVIHNVQLAAGSVYDTTLGSGDRFSFNKVVGPRTGKYGYVSAINGRGVRVTGGGVAQVASAIWLAIKEMDDIAIVEKSTYGKKYNQHYVESSADAIVTDYKAGTDFSFRYTGAGSITLYTYFEGEYLRCDVVKNA